jgi:putative ABC transport system substrate-binding protein
MARGQALPVVGYIHVVSATAAESTTVAFRKGLSEAGFIEGHNVAFEYRYADGQIARLSELARELANRRVTVIAAMGGSYSALAAKGATTTIPVVFTMGDADPVNAGVVASLARPWRQHHRH